MNVSLLLGAILTVNEIVAQHPVTGNPPSNFAWAPNGWAYVYSVAAEKESQPPIVRIHDVRTGADRTLFHAASEQRGSRSRAIAEIVWSHDSRRVALINAGALEVLDPISGRETKLVEDADDPQWSSDDSRIAYVHDNDIYTVDPSSKHIVRLTTNGSPMRINGDPDWLYSEEMDVEHAFRWSPDGTHIAYLSFDERPITPFPIENYLPRISVIEEQSYPLAGDKNARVTLNVVNTQSGKSSVLYDGGPKDEYVLSFTWSPDGRTVLDQIMDRAQKNLRWVAFGIGGGSHTVTQESDPTFVDVQPVPDYSRDGRTLYLLSERGGRQSLWRLDAQSGAGRQITGSYTVLSTERIDEAHHAAYVDAMYPTRRDISLLRVDLGTGAVQNLTPGGGSHDVILAQKSPDFIETTSSFNTPPAIYRRTLNGSSSTLIFRTSDLSRFNLGTVRPLEIPSKWGNLDATLVVPKDFDPNKRYPVVFTPYGGPLGVAPNQTMNRWPGLYAFLLAQHGFLSFTIDGPASYSDRASSERMFYHQMGLIAMAGQLAGVDWIKQQTFADPNRLGLFGWSYGGYLTAFTMTHAPGVFRAGVAGAPPADWRYYDTAYTERYMSKPQQAKAAYDATSVLPAAGKLQGSLLMLQGTSDDNVHLMNSISLLNAFMKAGKQVDYFVYPGERHGPRLIDHRRDIDSRMLDWWTRNLGP